MPAPDGDPGLDALVRELRQVRGRSLGATRQLDLPALHRAAAAAGLRTTGTEPEPAAIEALLRKAVDRLGGGNFQDAAEYTFGLVGGTKFEVAAERRKQAAKAHSVSTETFRKTHEKRILDQTAEAILGLVHAAVVEKRAESGEVQHPAVDLTEDEHKSGSQPNALAPNGDDRPATQRDSPSPRGRRGRIFLTLGALALTVLVVAVVVSFVRDSRRERTWNGMTATELERRYDGMLPGGQDGTDSHCADGDLPPSLPVDGASTPAVMAPEGTEVGRVHLRRAEACPTVVWARVVWHGDEQAKYQIPPGWTLHVVMHRPGTNTVTGEPEPSRASEIEYAISSMLSSARDCVFAEAYFTKDDKPDAKTASAPTSCVQV